MRVSDVFTSRFVRTSELEGRREPTLTIRTVTRENFTDGRSKLALWFEETSRAVALNRTNGRALAVAFGDETDTWRGQRVRLAVAPVDFKGETVPGIRVVPIQTARPEGVTAAPPRGPFDEPADPF